MTTSGCFGSPEAPTDILGEEMKYAFGVCFGALDTNADGVLSRQEFEEGFATMAPSTPKEAVEELFADIDKNGDGEISSDEFMAYSSEHPYLVITLLANLRAASEDGSSQPTNINLPDETTDTHSSLRRRHAR